MAQTGYTPILIYSSSTSSNAPAAGNLTNSTLGSELAINITDGKLFYKDNANAVQVIAWKTTPISAGGTGLTSYTAGDLLYYATGTTLSKLAIGSNGQILKSTGTAPAWENVSALAVTSISFGTTGLTPSTATQGAVTVAGTLVAANGGTGQSSYAVGDLLYASGTTALSKLGIGTAYYQLGVNAGGTAPAWQPSATSVLTAQGDLLYASAANTLARLAKNTTATRYLANTGTSNNPAWAQIDLTNGVTGVLPVANGGTNASSASITAFNNITGYTASGATGTTSTNLVFSTSPTLTTPKATTTIGVGNATPSASGAGITFPATQSASSDVNTLDDYEEGTFNMTVTAASGTITTINYATANGYYVKIGKMVKVHGYFWTSGAITLGTASGQMRISGLPFSVAEDINVGTMWQSPDTGNYNMPSALSVGNTASSTHLYIFKAGTVNNPAFDISSLYTGGGNANYFGFSCVYVTST